jgi:hypothetical protein
LTVGDPAWDPPGVRNAAAIGLVLAIAGCVDTSPTRVELTAAVERVSLSVQQGSLVASLQGTFDLALAVGDLAPGDATIADPPTFQLVAASDRAKLAVLDALPEGAAFPVTLKSGQNLTLHFSLTAQNTLAAADQPKICAGPVVVVASYRDSLSGGRATSVDGPPARITGCP